MTSGRERLVPAGETAPTALHTTSLRPAHWQSPRPRGPKRLLWALAEIKPAALFGALLARIEGERAFPVHVVGRRLTFRAAGKGTLQLRINDAETENCGLDNRGTLTVQVSVTHQP
ncbi:hypothetical protein ACWY4P_04330 [Streptomyces sp. LZ34]